MSANSPRHVMRCVPVVVPPQAVNDRSIYDSVAGFIDVALANTPQGDPKDAILWAKFENSADVSDLCYGDDWDLEGRAPPPLLLILGYVTGIQVWAVPANGEAFEVLSWRHGAVKTLRILPTPLLNDVELADEPIDQYAHKRPLMAICDNNSSGGGGGAATGSGSNLQYCSINFLSLKSKEQVKSIKFKNQIIEILANRSSIAVTFPEKIAVFDARTLEDRLTITACHPSPGLNPNPVALGPRWMAYAERRLLPSKRSSGGCDYDGVTSYTATVLNAAKSLGKGLRELGETMAAGFTGTTGSQSYSNLSGSGQAIGGGGEKRQPGVITILDIKYPITDASPVSGAPVSSTGDDRIVAHFVAHSDAVVALTFDYSGMLLITADKRGHDFHVFRIHAHPGGPSMSAVHHLYVLHRGDTSSKVQDICFSLDSRWVAVSTLRGTTHVFPITPYGGPAGVRTHGSSHVVNRLSRFHRSAGLSIDSRSSSPISHADYSLTQTTSAYPNPRTPPFPHPTVVVPLAQLRQPLNMGSGGGSGPGYNKGGQGRQRVSSLSDDLSKPLRVCGTFARPRAWLLETGTPRESSATKLQTKPMDSLFIMTAYGTLIQYDLDPKPLSNVPKEKVCDDTPIELDIEPKAQWNILRHDDSIEIQPPLPPDNILLKERLNDGFYTDDLTERTDERDALWLSQVEIITHAGPHRRLWMGPQFMFKTYNTPSGSSLSAIETESVEIGVGSPGNRPARSNPVNMPSTAVGNRPGVSVLIESSSYSSIEQSPRMTQIHYEQSESNFTLGSGDNQLREDLADAMRESPGHALIDAGSIKNSSVPPCQSSSLPQSSPSSTVRNNTVGSIAKVVNPLGTVTTIVKSDNESDLDEFKLSGEYTSDHYVHENCDEALFRPVVTVMGNKTSPNDNKEISYDRPAPMGLDLIVPVIEEKSINKTRKNKFEISEKEKSLQKAEDLKKFEELSAQNKKKTTKPVKKEIEKMVEEEKVVEEPTVTLSLPVKPKKSKNKVHQEEKAQSQPKVDIEPKVEIETLNYVENVTIKKPINKKKEKQVEKTLPSSSMRLSSPPSSSPPIIDIEQNYSHDDDDDFPELCQIADHFSIQQSLTKNSDYIIKTHKFNPDDFVIEPLCDVNIDDDDDDAVEKLDFNIMKIDDDNEINFTSIVKNEKKSKEKTPEQFFDTTQCSRYDDDDLSVNNIEESIFSETSLAPLEPFISENFENLTFNNENSELMKFESPEEEEESDGRKLVKKILLDEIEIDDDTIELQPRISIERSNNNSSDETEDSFNDNNKKTDDCTRNKLNDDDEELQPLISTATTSSETTPNCLNKAIVDSLPENQKDINKQQQQQQQPNNNKRKSRKKKR